MRIQGVKVVCCRCGSDDIKVAGGVLAECKRCGLGMLIREFSQWKNGAHLLEFMDERARPIGE